MEGEGWARRRKAGEWVEEIWRMDKGMDIDVLEGEAEGDGGNGVNGSDDSVPKLAPPLVPCTLTKYPFPVPTHPLPPCGALIPSRQKLMMARAVLAT